MTGVLLIGGNGPSKKYFRSIIGKYEFVIAADSGVDLALSLSIEPDLIVGDMDSISGRQKLKNYPPEQIIEYPHDKDETDTEIGLRIFREMGYTDIILAGGGGGRLDHVLAILNIFERKFHPDIWITDREEVYFISGTFYIKGWINSTVSLFPVGGPVNGLDSKGLKWTLKGFKWKRGEYGISNLVTDDELYIKVKEGNLLLIRNNILRENKYGREK
ncbi:MAG: thiamine diphosphokinase [Spirochaetes bacterium]|nr:thiamine diphosphokinase [Spirochaetota bacterium]